MQNYSSLCNRYMKKFRLLLLCTALKLNFESLLNTTFCKLNKFLTLSSSKLLQYSFFAGDLSSNLLGKLSSPKEKRSKDELRQLWKMAIDQTILLVRMEKENARLKGESVSYSRLLSIRKARSELRGLWKMAIKQTLLLVRMEKENNRLKGNGANWYFLCQLQPFDKARPSEYFEANSSI